MNNLKRERERETFSIKKKKEKKNTEPGYKQGKSQVTLDAWIQQDMKSLDFSIIRMNLTFLLFGFASFN